jgi:hypothetical protein
MTRVFSLPGAWLAISSVLFFLLSGPTGILASPPFGHFQRLAFGLSGFRMGFMFF